MKHIDRERGIGEICPIGPAHPINTDPGEDEP